jgi:hypothetical protein
MDKSPDTLGLVTDGVAGFNTQYEHWHTLDRPFGEHRTYSRRIGEASIRAPAKNQIPVTHVLSTNQPTTQPTEYTQNYIKPINSRPRPTEKCV